MDAIEKLQKEIKRLEKEMDELLAISSGIIKKLQLENKELRTTNNKLEEERI